MDNTQHNTARVSLPELNTTRLEEGDGRRGQKREKEKWRKSFNLPK